MPGTWLYAKLRADFFTAIDTKFSLFKILCRTDKFVSLMGNVDEFIISKMGKFIYDCFKLRQTTAV